MDLKEFMVFCNNYDFRIAAFNTYHVGNGIFCCFIVSQKSDSGQFYEIKCSLNRLDAEFDRLSKVIELRTSTYLIDK